MKNNETKTKRLKPLWLVFLLDFLLAVAMILVFAYFHHVRILWGNTGSDDIIDQFGKTSTPEETGSLVGHINHEWTLESTVLPDCTNGGYTVYVCDICGAVKNDDITDPSGHKLSEPSGDIEASDNENGYSGDVLCSVCGALIQKGHEIPATGHKNTHIMNYKEATCLEEGYTGDIFCDDCNKIIAYGATIRVLEHNWTVENIVEPSCTEGGYTVYRCSVCGAEKNDDPVKAKGHIQSAAIGAIEPTDTSNGYTGDIVCTVCGITIVKGHDIPASGHKHIHTVNYKEATCSEEGYSGDIFCDDCNKIVAYGAATPQLPHKMETSHVVSPTCIENGYTVYRCSVCGYEEQDDFTKAKGHTQSELINAKAANDSENGYTGDIVCTVCGAMLQKGHDIPAMGHRNTKIINLKQATCSENGYTGDTFCIDCNKVIASGASTPLLAHTYVVISVLAPSCTAEGYTLNRCSVCGAELKNNIKAATPHSMGSDGKCIYCGLMMLDTSGDFGASFPEKFIQSADKISLSSESEISSYANENGIELKEYTDGKYISLYRSHDVFLTVSEINTHLYYAGTGKTYTVQYFVYDIYVRNLSNLCTSYSTSGSKPMSTLISEVETDGKNVVAAVNGDYMGNSNYCKVCIRNGNTYRKGSTVSGDVCALNYDGTMKTYLHSEYSWDSVATGNPYQVWNFGPALIDSEGHAITDYSTLDSYVVDNRHPRTAIGYYEPGHYSFIVVDGRSDDSQGVRIIQLAELCEQLGCKAAYNMDGGDSSQAWVGDTVIRDDQDRGNDQRSLYDIICITDNS